MRGEGKRVALSRADTLADGVAVKQMRAGRHPSVYGNKYSHGEGERQQHVCRPCATTLHLMHTRPPR